VCVCAYLNTFVNLSQVYALAQALDDIRLFKYFVFSLKKCPLQTVPLSFGFAKLDQRFVCFVADLFSKLSGFGQLGAATTVGAVAVVATVTHGLILHIVRHGLCFI
jgi:hypothetical protein